MAVHGERRIRLVAAQHGFDRMARGIQLRIRKRPFAEQRREAGRDEQRIALAQRHVEPLGEMQHHLAAGLRAARFDEAQVARGDVRVERERHLAQSPALPPRAQQRADARRAAGGRGGRMEGGGRFMWQMIGNPAHLGHYL